MDRGASNSAMVAAIGGLDSDAVEILSPGAASPVIVLCDHADNRLPGEYGDLGLPAGEFERHIAYDIGAAGVARELSGLLGATSILSRWSRLLIDLNRGLDDPTLIMRLSDGAVIPGNRHLDDAERERRVERFYRPYHNAVSRLIDERLERGIAPVLLSVHSFTPVWRSRARAWHTGVLWDKDPRLAVPLIAALRGDRALVVGDNEPYTGKLRGDTLWQHGTCRGLAHAIIEIRQDLIADGVGQLEWAKRIGGVMASLLGDPAVAGPMAQVAYHGSYTDPE